MTTTLPIPAPTGKPRIPYEGFPLKPHDNGQWYKYIGGRCKKVRFFGKWDDPDAAERRYQAEKDDLLAGRVPGSRTPGALRVNDLCNAFLKSRQTLQAAGKLKSRTLRDYKRTLDALVARFDGCQVDQLKPADFEDYMAAMAQRKGLVPLGNEIQRIRTVFIYAHESDLIDKPVKFGPIFKRPSRSDMRKHQAVNGKKNLPSGLILDALDEACIQMKAMILLGVNCGFGNTDCARLDLDHLDLEGGWHTFPRPKSGIARRCPLWRETIEAIRAVLARRRTPKDPADAKLVFLTRAGRPWVSEETEDNAIGKAWAKLMVRINNQEERATFYCLRHTFATIGDQACDKVCLDAIMGHERAAIPANYKHELWDSRLRNVTGFVHDWLYAAAEQPADGSILKFQARA